MVALLAAPAGARAQAFGFGGPAALNTNAASDSGGDFTPHLATDGAGVWVAAWSSTDTLGGTIGSDFDILFARSTDDGATWSAPAALPSNAASDSGNDQTPRLAADGAGNWVCVWTSTDTLGGTIGSDNDILVARSTDGGATWGAPAALNSNAAADAASDTEPDVATDGAGAWVTAWASTDTFGGTVGSDGDLRVSHSADGGATWSAVAILNSTAATDANSDNRPRLATDGAGTWVAAWARLNGTDFDLFTARSTDAGASWSAVAALNTNASTDAGSDFDVALAADGADAWVAAWWSLDDLGGTIGTDGDILAARSSDDGATWSAPAALNSHATTDGGDLDAFPVVTSGGAGEWLVVYYSTHTLGGTIGSDNDLLVARSTDDGATWSASAALAANAAADTGTDWEVTLATDAAGAWVAVWRSNDSLGGTVGTDDDIFVSASNSVPVALSALALD